MTVFECFCLAAFFAFVLFMAMTAAGYPNLLKDTSVDKLAANTLVLEGAIRREVANIHRLIKSKRILVCENGENECVFLSSGGDERWYRTDFESVPVLGAETLTKANGSLESVPCKSFGDVPVNVLSSLCEHGARLEDAGADKGRSDDAA